MAVSEDRKYTKQFIYELLEGIKGKTLGEVDKSRQFERTIASSKITGIAGDVIEQSVFGYSRDSKQECDIEIDGILTELKTTGVRIPKTELKFVKGKTGEEYYKHLGAKEGISITGVTFEPTIQLDFETSHFWEKAKHLLIVFYEYDSYEVVPANEYSRFIIVDYTYNSFSETEKGQLRNDWEIVRDYLQNVYAQYPSQADRNENLVGFTHKLRPELLLIELVPGFSKKENKGKISYTKPRYRLKKTFVDYIVKGHFNKKRLSSEISLKESFSSFGDLDKRCHELTLQYKGKTVKELIKLLGVNTTVKTKDIVAKCVLRMFDANCNRLNQISDFNKVGIIAKTITMTPKGARTEDMKLKHIDFDEWCDRDVDFEDSDVYYYFSEHSFLCPIFKENEDGDVANTTFEGFKRFAFDDSFIYGEVKRMWDDSRKLVHTNELAMEYVFDKEGNIRKNKDGTTMCAPNFPKSAEYTVFFRGGNTGKSSEGKTETVNGIQMLPQFFWLKGSYVVDKLNSINFL